MSAMDSALGYRDSDDGFGHVVPQAGYGTGCPKYNLKRRNKCKEGKLVFSWGFVHNYGRIIIFLGMLLWEGKLHDAGVKLD